MPITHILTLEEIKLIQAIEQIKDFKIQKRNFKNDKVIDQIFINNTNRLKSNINYNNRYDILNLAFEKPKPDENIPKSEYDNDTEPTNYKNKIIAKNIFQKYIDEVGENQYLYFRFHKNKTSILGYLDINCNTPNCNFIKSNSMPIDEIEDGDVEEPKNIKGILHKKGEFDEFMKTVIDNVYIIRRKYNKDGVKTKKKDRHTFILSNTAEVTSASRLENHGGTCCPINYP